jgi:hypothetical protein
LEEDPPSEAERASLEAAAGQIAERVWVQLEEEDLARGAAVPFVCHRPAGILADPGWIEAHFSLRDLSTPIRRAGLDLDPGYLPWLGAVVKFVYE